MPNATAAQRQAPAGRPKVQGEIVREACINRTLQDSVNEWFLTNKPLNILVNF
jgi:hypothetical protein